jgi:predicted O-methyltransferase YrrM
MIWSVSPFLHASDPWVRDEQPGVIQSIYLDKFLLASLVRPKRILEIGVRAGYSAAAFLSACPEASYYGVDCDASTYGGVPGMFDYAQKMLRQKFPQCELRFFKKNSQHETPETLLDGYMGPFDLAHVDADHSKLGCLNDLRLARQLVSPKGWILLDDWSHPAHQEDIRGAVGQFVNEWPSRYVAFPSIRGDCLIKPF